MINNKSKTVTILGASSDIGLDLTKKFLKLGYNVNAHYFSNKSKLKKIQSIYRENIRIFRFDLKNIYKWEKFIKKNNYLKRTDIFVSLTGYIDLSKFETFNLKSVYDHLNINYFSSIIITNYFYRFRLIS